MLNAGNSKQPYNFDEIFPSIIGKKLEKENVNQKHDLQFTVKYFIKTILSCKIVIKKKKDPDDNFNPEPAEHSCIRATLTIKAAWRSQEISACTRWPGSDPLAMKTLPCYTLPTLPIFFLGRNRNQTLLFFGLMTPSWPLLGQLNIGQFKPHGTLHINTAWHIPFMPAAIDPIVVRLIGDTGLNIKKKLHKPSRTSYRNFY